MMDSNDSMWKRITFIEPVVFFIMFSFTLSDSVITDAIVYKTCIKLMGENGSECSILHENSSSDAAKDLQDKVQPHIASLLVAKSSVETLFPTILILLLGPWSDTNGRKPLLTVPFLGSIAYYSLYALISSLNIDAHWFILPSIISSILGGFPVILLTSFCYVADITGSHNRAWRLGFLDFVLFGGQLIGYLVNPVVFKQFGYCVVFAMSAVSCLLGLLYSYFILMESVYIGTGYSVKSIFKLTNIRGLFRFVTLKRNAFDRLLFWCCLIIIALHDDNMQGSATIMYLFTKRFGWSLMDFSTYSVIQLSVTMIGMISLIKMIAPLLKLPDTVSIMIASLSNCGSSITKALASQQWHIYLATGVGMFCLAPASLVRSVISKTVSQHDIGKAFAVTTTMEKIGPFATTPIFVYLYTNFIKIYPCPVWFLPAVLSFFIVIFAAVVEYRWKKLEESESNLSE